jgi:energy-coupling factor transporter ATP-binding protein EcfA2
VAELLLVGRGPAPLGAYSLKITSGERICVTGGPGSGRTTLCRLMAGVLSPDAGGLTLDGAPYPPPDGRATAPVGYLPFPAPPLGCAPDILTETGRLLGIEELIGREGPFSTGENQLLHLGAILGRGHAFLALDQALAPLGDADAERVLETLKKTAAGILLTAAEPLAGWRHEPTGSHP